MRDTRNLGQPTEFEARHLVNKKVKALNAATLSRGRGIAVTNGEPFATFGGT